MLGYLFAGLVLAILHCIGLIVQAGPFKLDRLWTLTETSSEAPLVNHFAGLPNDICLQIYRQLEQDAYAMWALRLVATRHYVLLPQLATLGPSYRAARHDTWTSLGQLLLLLQDEFQPQLPILRYLHALLQWLRVVLRYKMNFKAAKGSPTTATLMDSLLQGHTFMDTFNGPISPTLKPLLLGSITSKLALLKKHQMHLPRTLFRALERHRVVLKRHAAHHDVALNLLSRILTQQLRLPTRHRLSLTQLDAFLGISHYVALPLDTIVFEQAQAVLQDIQLQLRLATCHDELIERRASHLRQPKDTNRDFPARIDAPLRAKDVDDLRTAYYRWHGHKDDLDQTLATLFLWLRASSRTLQPTLSDILAFFLVPPEQANK